MLRSAKKRSTLKKIPTLPRYLQKIALWAASVPNLVLIVMNKAAILEHAHMNVAMDTCVTVQQTRPQAQTEVWLSFLQSCLPLSLPRRRVKCDENARYAKVDNLALLQCRSARV